MQGHARRNNARERVHASRLNWVGRDGKSTSIIYEYVYLTLHGSTHGLN